MSSNDILEKYKSIPPNEEEIKKLFSKSKHLAIQSFDTLSDPTKISPLTPEIMSRQATINIGTIGHVTHGKTTLVSRISENYRISLVGYANAKLYKCPKCPDLEAYRAYSADKEDKPKCEKCGEYLELLRHISFVDCPGHDIIMNTMLNGASVMDAALLLIAANCTCPQPQTREHLVAVQNMDLKNIIIVQNKIDLIKEEEAKKNYQQIKTFVKGTKATNSPIIPISAQYEYNIEAVIRYLCDLPIPKRDFISPPKFIIIRSFDINKPGTEYDKLKGGVVRGTLIRGILRVGDIIEIRPGELIKDNNGKYKVKPLYSRIISLEANQTNDLLYAVPGGLIGVGLKLDPYLTRKNRLVGNILGYPGKLPNVYTSIIVETHLMVRYVGLKEKDKNTSYIDEIKFKEELLISIGSNSISSIVNDISGDNKDIVKFSLSQPVCVEIGENVTLSRKVEKWRLIGWGKVLDVGETI